jgi:hypothetical protein
MKAVRSSLKLLLVLPDGTGVRNFLGRRFLEVVLERGPVVVWHAFNDGGRTLEQWRTAGGGLTWEPLPSYRERRIARVLRLGKSCAQLYRDADNGGESTLERRRRSLAAQPTWRARAMATVTRGIGTVAATDRGVARLDRLHARWGASAGNQRAYEELLRRERPDLVFCAHQRVPRAVPAMLAARRLGIPTATFIYSWDNLPMGRMAVHADHYFVWSETMREEMRTIYPDVAQERVHVVGTPQFEPHFDERTAEPREGFLRASGLDPARRVVCFSGADTTTSPHDPDFLADVAAAIRGMPEVERPQLLFRRCPSDDAERYEATLAAYPEIARSDPLWIAGEGRDWSRFTPTRGDSARLANLVRHCDMVVNLGSTMALDFAIRGKPSIYLNYEAHSQPGGWTAAGLYREPHFARVHRLQPVHWARSPGEIGALVAHALRHPEDRADARRAWIEETVALPLDCASERFADAMARIAGPKVSAR